MKKRLIFDFETRSACDLKKSGAYKYSLDPTTRPTCLAIKIHGNPKVYFLDFYGVNRKWEDQPETLRNMWLKFIADKYLFGAHNAFFEKCIYQNLMVKRYGWPSIPSRLYRCTAAKAAACALPRSLENAGHALQLVIQKDKRGYVAMMATCKPTKQYNAWIKANTEVKAGKKVGPKKLLLSTMPMPSMFLEPSEAPEVWNTLYTYCKIDVLSEEKLDDTLPDLIPFEQEIWFLNQSLNWRGLRIDIPLAEKIVKIMSAETEIKLKELDQITMGLVTKPGSRKAILNFLALEDIVLPDIRAKTVDDVLKDGDLSEDMRRLLEIRKALSKTSTKKYQGFIDRANFDYRVRDILLYHGASTGRDSGSGIQVQNFPKGLIEVDKNNPYAAVKNALEYDKETLHLLYGENLSWLFSSILRNMILPSEDHELFVADFAKIEVAVLWWLADNKPGLEILNSGKDPYIFMAAENSGKTYEEVEQAIEEGEQWAIDARQLGKAQILGCGFGMGPDKFQATAHDQYRLSLTKTQSKSAVYAYREANEAVPALWKKYEQAAVRAIETKNKITIGKCKFFCADRFLWVELPSGRRLAYRDPQISWRQTDFGPRKTVEFWAVNSKTKKWALERTWGGTFTENLVQATARDLMMNALPKLEKKGYRVMLCVHDEIICEKPIGKGSLDQMIGIMCETPTWADSELPIDAKGWRGPRYRK